MNKKKQHTVAAEAGITQGYLSKVMAGKANPTIEVLEAVAKAYGISLTTLIRLISKRGRAAS